MPTTPYGYEPSTPEAEAVFRVLSRYFGLLQDGKAEKVKPALRYVWKFYSGEMTIERMRAGVKKLDDYLGAYSQKSWTSNYRNEAFTAGPDLGRLPDAALVAMFQELDAALAPYKGV